MILDDIVKDKKQEVEARKYSLPISRLQKMALNTSPPLDLYSALVGRGIALIAEVKKASPSRGILCPDFNPISIARAYAESGVAAISVLTESKYFQGSLDHLEYISCALGSIRPPLLRKDFIFDPYQIWESRAFGADAVLLITAILGSHKLYELLSLSKKLNLSCLVEVHNEAEVKIALESGAQIIGINNRDLNTFQVDISTTEKLRPLIPPDRLVVSESGIHEQRDILRLRKIGVNAVLVGESLVTSNNIRSKIRELQ